MALGSAAVEFEWIGSGIGNVIPSGATPSHRRLPQPADNGKLVRYYIRHTLENQWEESLGTWNHGTQTLTRGQGAIIGFNGTSSVTTLVAFTATAPKLVAWVVEAADVVEAAVVDAVTAFNPSNY